jgi:hypothetical protein
VALLQGSPNGARNDAVPRITILLGGAGLIPFVWYGAQHAPMRGGGSGAAGSTGDSARAALPPRLDEALTRWEAFTGLSFEWLKSGDQATVRRRFLTYSAAILSFMGGVHWGLAMAAPLGTPVAAQYVVSVVPALVAWGALNVDQASLTPHALTALSFLGLYMYEEALLQRRRIAPWYTFLRTPLTVGVVLTTTVGAYMARETKERLI